MLRKWGKPLSSSPIFLSTVASQVTLFNKCIKIGINSIFNSYFFLKNLDHIGELFDDSVRSKNWNGLKEKHDLTGNKKFFKAHIIDGQNYFEKYFENFELLCKDIDILLWQAICDTKISIFQYKLLHNILCHNKKLYKYPQHLFATSLLFLNVWNSNSCSSLFDIKTNILWNKLTQ